MKSSDNAVILIGHGSMIRGFDASMKKIARALKKESSSGPVLCAYLEINRPSISEAIDRAVRGGAKEVRLLPYFLLTGKHVTRHIPEIVSESRKKHPRTRILLCPYLGYHEKIVSVVKQRIREA